MPEKNVQNVIAFANTTLTDGPDLLFNVTLLSNLGLCLGNGNLDSQPKCRLHITAQERDEESLTLHTLHTQLIALLLLP